MHETKATHVSGTIFEFTSVNAGQPFVVRDSDGNLILRDRGVIRQVIQVDTLGDVVPGGAFVADVSRARTTPRTRLRHLRGAWLTRSGRRSAGSATAWRHAIPSPAGLAEQRASGLQRPGDFGRA